MRAGRSNANTTPARHRADLVPTMTTSSSSQLTCNRQRRASYNTGDSLTGGARQADSACDTERECVAGCEQWMSVPGTLVRWWHGITKRRWPRLRDRRTRACAQQLRKRSRAPAWIEVACVQSESWSIARVFSGVLYRCNSSSSHVRCLFDAQLRHRHSWRTHTFRLSNFSFRGRLTRAGGAKVFALSAAQIIPALSSARASQPRSRYHATAIR